MMGIIAALAFLLAPAVASAAELYVSPNGSDAGQCTAQAPCASIARACQVAIQSPERVVTIYVAGGTYNGGGCNAVYYQVIVVFGDCSNKPDIILFGNDVGFWAQDHVILAVQCIGIRSLGNNSIAFASRQFAIMDINHVRLGRLYGGIGISAQEMSKANCGASLEVAGEMGVVVTAGDKSTVSLNCPVTILENPSISFFATIARGGLLDASSAHYTGAIRGQKYSCDNGEVSGSAAIPGTGTTVKDCIER
jgi:hypothetical protein